MSHCELSHFSSSHTICQPPLWYRLGIQGKVGRNCSTPQQEPELSSCIPASCCHRYIRSFILNFYLETPLRSQEKFCFLDLLTVSLYTEKSHHQFWSPFVNFFPPRSALKFQNYLYPIVCWLSITHISVKNFFDIWHRLLHKFLSIYLRDYLD